MANSHKGEQGTFLIAVTLDAQVDAKPRRHPL